MGLLKLLLVAVLAFSLSACAYNSNYVNSSKKTLKLYRVQRGETLYSIAWRYSLDYRQLAYWNKIAIPYRIFPGQRIYLNPPPGKSYYPPQRTAASKPGKPSVPIADRRVPALPRDIPDTQLPRVPATTSKSRPADKPASKWVASKHLDWQWPTQGRVIRKFTDSRSGKQGIDIKGSVGQKIIASAGGKVVYSGNGLKGYGELVIIKHNDRFLSAYAHNRKRSVSEGAIVKSGQIIAELGQTGISTPMLHFEIRENGRPVDPLKYLPGNQP